MADSHNGTTYRYDCGCRCTDCRAAKMTARREQRARARAEKRPSYLHSLALSRALKENYRGTCIDCGAPTSWGNSTGPTLRCRPCHLTFIAPEHGTASRYKKGCRCDACRQANTDYCREYQRKRRRAQGIPERRARAAT